MRKRSYSQNRYRRRVQPNKTTTNYQIKQQNRRKKFRENKKSTTSPFNFQVKPKQIMRPKSLSCYICGRQYGTASLGIHIKSCKKKWVIQESLKPRKNRRRFPTTPRGLHQLLAKKKITRKDINAYNCGAFYKFNQEALVKCQFCNRSFLEERMKGHRQICTKDRPFKYLDDQRIKGAGQNYGNEMYKQALDDDTSSVALLLFPCNICGRNFRDDRLSKHQAICQKNKQNEKKRERLIKRNSQLKGYKYRSNFNSETKQSKSKIRFGKKERKKETFDFIF